MFAFIRMTSLTLAAVLLGSLVLHGCAPVISKEEVGR